MKKPFKLRYRDPEPCERREVYPNVIMVPRLLLIYCKHCGRTANEHGLVCVKLEANK